MQPKFTHRRLSTVLKLIPMLFLFCLSTSRTSAQCSWSAGTAYPINVLDNALATVGTNMYSFGGVSAGAVIGNSYSFNGTTWTAIAALPGTREFPSAVSNGTDVFIMGGYDGVSALTNTLWRYNVATNNYTTLAPMPGVSWAQTAVYYNGNIYKFGGQVDLVGTTTSALHIYNIAAGTWSTGAPMPFSASFIGGFELGGFIYAVGGNTGAASLKTYRYDPVANTWNDAAIADLPAVRWGAATGAYGGFGVMAGGYDAVNPSNTAIIWDPVGNAWSSIPNMLGDRARMNGAVLGTSFYAVGGRCTAAACGGFTGSNDNQKLTCNFTPCSGTPNPGATTSTANPVCPTIAFTLGIANAQGTGSTHQWQSSPTGAAGTWTNIVGATGSTYTTSITTATWFRDSVRCTLSSTSGTSTPLQITINPPAACYCVPTYASGCTLGDYIARVRLNGLDNSSLCSTPPFTYYNAVPAPTLLIGFTYQLIVTVGPDTFGQNVGAWIDYNIDGVFQTTEFLATPINAGASGTATLTFTVPAGATAGTTRLRIRGGDDVAMNNTQACGPSNSSFGEAEDYNVILAPCVQGQFTSQPANVTTQCSQNASFTATSSGSALQYLWEYRTPTNPIPQLVIDGGTAPAISGATTSTLNLSNVPPSWNGYQFRAVIQSPCTAPEFSNWATLTVTPYVINVSPTSANICSGQIQQLRILNTAGVTTTASFTSGPLNFNVPDNVATPSTFTIPVSGIPVGAIISDIRIHLNMTHTYPADMVINLKGTHPTNILSLYKHNTNTDNGAASVPTAGFFNAIASQVGTTQWKAVPTPFRYGITPPTGPFAADALNGVTNPGYTIMDPTGWVSNTTTWGSLINAGDPNGTWTLAMCDGGPGDLGNFTGWTIDIDYAAATFLQGIWTATPAAPNTMFTDAAATIPYTGTLASQIWVKPTVNTTYCVSVTTPLCGPSAPVCIPVNVFNSITNFVAPTNQTACDGATATFTATATGGPIAWQWQQSVDGGVTWTNIVGANSATLTVPVTMQMNNNRYRVTGTVATCSSTVTSNAAVLTVNPKPTVVISSPNTQIVPGGQTTLTATSTPAAAANGFIWFRGTDTVRDASGNVIRGNSITANIDQLGSYTVRVVDVNGCVNTSNILKIGADASDRLWIFPNPTNDGRFQVRWFYDGVTTERRKVSVYTITGQKIAEREFDLGATTPQYLRMDFDLSKHANGTYVVKVLNKFHETVKSGLVVIQH